MAQTMARMAESGRAKIKEVSQKFTSTHNQFVTGKDVHTSSGSLRMSDPPQLLCICDLPPQNQSDVT